jgi:hypothetical protein
MIHVVAHAGETHSDAVETIAHTAAPWYIAVPLFIMFVAMIGYLTWLVSGKRPAAVMAVLSVVLLISGFTMFNISAAISVISITVGIVLAGVQAFGSLSE